MDDRVEESLPSPEHRKPSQLNCEDRDEHDRGDERRHRSHAREKHENYAVEGSALPESCGDAADQADDHDDDRRIRDQAECRRQPRQDEREDVVTELERPPEVALHDVAEPREVPREERLIETVLLGDRGHCLGAWIPALHQEPQRVAGHQVERGKHEERDGEEGECEGQQSLEGGQNHVELTLPD